MNPVRGVRDAQMRAGITPTNHARHNAAAVREQSQMNALRKAAEVHEDTGDKFKLPPGEANCSVLPLLCTQTLWLSLHFIFMT